MNESEQRRGFIVEEMHGAMIYNVYEIYKLEDTLKPIKHIDKNWQSFKSFIMDIFLPHGYPNSVSKDYFQYQIWDSIQAFASSITGSICTHAVLKGAGVGDESASLLSATITWLLKDGASMVGKIVFAWLKGTKLDCECKKWRLFADVMNDLAMLLDLLSAFFQSHFMVIICISGMIKAVVSVAGGCTRAALTQHQSRWNNMADVSAKDGSQETLVNLLALICSLILIPYVTKSYKLIWLIYISMTIIHLLANYLAVKSVVMETFNIPRFMIFANHYISEGKENRHFLSVDEVNRRENVFFSLKQKEIEIKLGCSFKDLCGKKSLKEIKEVLHLYKDCDYMLCLSKVTYSKIFIKVALSSKATVLTKMEALYQACLLLQMLKSQRFDLKHLKNEKNWLYYESSSRINAKNTFSTFIEITVTNEFDINNVFFEDDLWRLNW